MRGHIITNSSNPGDYLPEVAAVASIASIAIAFLLIPCFYVPPSNTILGFHHQDELVYFACAREYFDNGFSFLYASPYSNTADSPRIYSHFVFLLIGALWKAGVSFPVLNQLLRVVAGGGTLLLSIRIMRIALRDSPIRNLMCILLVTGGGLAWLVAGTMLTRDFVADLILCDTASQTNWIYFYPASFSEAEGGYGEWGLNLARSIVLTVEGLYHCLFFACILCVICRKYIQACLWLFLTWWSHPYTGIELGAIVSSFFFIEMLLKQGRIRTPFAVSIVINVLFLTYYLLILPRFPEHASVWQQMESYGHPLLLSKLIAAFGLLIPLAFAGIARREFIVELRNNPICRLMTLWLVIVAALVFHDRLPFVRGVQPLHFARGYLYIPLVYFSTHGLENFSSYLSKKRRAISLTTLAAVVVLLHIPDNIIWLTSNARMLSKKGQTLFSMPNDGYRMFAHLDSLPRTTTFLSIHPNVSESFVPVLTHHRTVLGHHANVPMSNQKRPLVESFRSTFALEPLQQLHADGLLFDKASYQRFTTQHPGLGKLLFEEAGVYAVLLK